MSRYPFPLAQETPQLSHRCQDHITLSGVRSIGGSAVWQFQATVIQSSSLSSLASLLFHSDLGGDLTEQDGQGAGRSKQAVGHTESLYWDHSRFLGARRKHL